MPTLVSKLVALSVEKYYMALTEIQLKYVTFMAPLAKKVPDPWHTRTLFTRCCRLQFVTAMNINYISGILRQQFITAKKRVKTGE